MIKPLPDYKNLDISGEAQQAAARMEARAQEPASAGMFEQLVRPLLSGQVKTVSEFGCGTAALSRRIARAAPQVVVYASDKSEGMLAVARHLAGEERLDNLHIAHWDLLDDDAFPFAVPQFDLILSSVVIPYFEDEAAIPLISRLAARLAPGGALAFMEQDWLSDSLYYPNFQMVNTVLGKESRRSKRTLGLGLRSVLREAGLNLLPRCSYLWSDVAYGPYTRDLLERFADSACAQGKIQPAERDEWKETLTGLAGSGDFYYGIVYHLIAGRRES